MLQQDQPDNYVIATGETHSLEEFTAAAFECAGLDWHEHVATDPALYRPTEIAVGKGNPAKALKVLGWQARSKMRDVVRMMMQEERNERLRR
jgi:GDPmannose 4,6-dehydratase